MLSVSIFLVLKILHYLDSRGFSKTQICQDIGLEYDKLISNQIQPTESQLEAFWKRCCELTHSDEFGFHLGQQLSLDHLGAFGLMLRHSETLGESIEYASQYAPLISSVFDIKKEIQGDELAIYLIPNSDFISKYPIRAKQASLLAVSLLIKSYADLTHKKPVLTHAAFPGYVKNRTLLAFCFDGIIEESSDYFLLRFEIRTLAFPILYADDRLKSQAVEIASAQFQQNPTLWSNRVQGYLSTHFDATTTNLNSVAQHFGMSPRSLQRKLKIEESNFNSLLVKHKLNLAKLLLNKSNSTKQVASQLGFSDVSGLYKFFKKWTGMTITSYLNQHRGKV